MRMSLLGAVLMSTPVLLSIILIVLLVFLYITLRKKK